jgi:UDP-2,3-diacylglucosamine pyrophosphatase LpxH
MKISYQPNQKVLVFSDTHLTSKFDNKKFLFLKRIISEADRVIINGDFWDMWYTSFDDFLDSEYKQLFPLLLARKAVYIYGNHDPKNLCDNRVGLFSVFAAEEYSMTIGSQIYSFEHGHEPLKIQKRGWLSFYSKILDFSEKKNFKPTFYLLDFLQYLGYKVFGEKVMCQSSFARNRNNILKQNPKVEWSFFGDTHSAEIDPKIKFCNSGCVLLGSADYLTIQNGKTRLINAKY